MTENEISKLILDSAIDAFIPPRRQARKVSNKRKKVCVSQSLILSQAHLFP